MTILGFLLIFLCLAFFLAWVRNFFYPPSPRSKQRPRQPPPSYRPPIRQPDSRDAPPTPPPASPGLATGIATPDRLVPPARPAATRPLPQSLSLKHHLNIFSAQLRLKEIRQKAAEAESKLPVVLGLLRRTDPFVVEEICLLCCQDQGWEIRHNHRYTGDGGVDGRTWINNQLYLIQAKRYRSHIDPAHVLEFRNVIQCEGAAGGLFIHTGKTGPLSRQLLRDSQIVLLSGQRLVDFVLGKPIKIVGITISASS